jgi:hypothetical protein
VARRSYWENPDGILVGYGPREPEPADVDLSDLRNVHLPVVGGAFDMKSITEVSAKLDLALTEVTGLKPKVDTLNTKMDDMRQQISDLLVGAGVPDSLAAQVDAVLAAIQQADAAADTTIAENTGTIQPPANSPPTITLAVNVLSSVAPGSVQLIPTVSDPDDTISKVECYQDGVLIFTKSAAPFGYTVTGLVARTAPYVFTEKAYDSRGASTTSNAVSLTVTAQAETPIQVQPI